MEDSAEEITHIISAFKQDGKQADNNRKLLERVHNHYYDDGSG